MELRDDVEARAFGNQVIRDLIGTRAEHYFGWTLDIAEGERALPSVPFVVANCVGLLPRAFFWDDLVMSEGLFKAPQLDRRVKATLRPRVVRRLRFRSSGSASASFSSASVRHSADVKSIRPPITLRGAIHSRWPEGESVPKGTVPPQSTSASFRLGPLRPLQLPDPAPLEMC